MEEKVKELRCNGEVKILQYIVVEYTRLFCHAFVCVIALLHLLILGKCYAVHINASSL